MGEMLLVAGFFIGTSISVPDQGCFFMSAFDF